MKLKASKIPYSSVVGGGLQLIDENGRAGFQLLVIGTTSGVSKKENDAICDRLADLINAHGLSAPHG